MAWLQSIQEHHDKQEIDKKQPVPIRAYFTKVRCGETEKKLKEGAITSIQTDKNELEACLRIECESVRPFHCFFPRVLEMRDLEVTDKTFTLGDYSEPLTKPSWREGWLHLRSPKTATEMEVYARIAIGGMAGLPEAFADLKLKVQIQYNDLVPEGLLEAHDREVVILDLLQRNKKLTDVRLNAVRDWVDKIFARDDQFKRARIARLLKQYIVTQVGQSPPPSPATPAPPPQATLPPEPPKVEPPPDVKPKGPEPPKHECHVPKPEVEDLEVRAYGIYSEAVPDWMGDLGVSAWIDPAEDPNSYDYTTMSPQTIWKTLSRPFVKARKRLDRKEVARQSPSVRVKANISLQDAPLPEKDEDDMVLDKIPEGDVLEDANESTTLVEAPLDGVGFSEMRKHGNSTPASLAAPAASALVVQSAAGVLIFVDSMLMPYAEEKVVRFRSVKSCNDVLYAHVAEEHGLAHIRVESASGEMPLAVLDTKAAIRPKGTRPQSNRHAVIHRVIGKTWDSVGPPFAWVFHVTSQILEVHYMELEGELFLRVHRSADLQFIQRMEDTSGSVVFRREPARSFTADGTPLSARLDTDDHDGFAFWVSPGVDLVLIACTLLAVQKLA